MVIFGGYDTVNARLCDDTYVVVFNS
jgi:hypothetical protein